jgi:hypothetical protein
MADTGKHVRVKAGYSVVAIVIQLSPLHFRAMAQLVFANAVFLNQFSKMYFNPAMPVTQ